MIEKVDEQVASNFYYDEALNSQAVKLLPGEYYVTDKDMLLVTVLGSCVAACIRDSQNGIGGMNHFMLPENCSDTSVPVNSSARYGTFAMEILINQLLKLGARRSNLEAKVFGGGNVLGGLTVTNVGQRNADFALEFLAIEQIRVVAQDLADIYPRKVYFFPRSNRVLVKKLRTVHSNTVSVREQEYGKRLQQSNVGGDVELFS
ncbi:chemoreceptor glutamine deamidase CheD [Nitrosomonas sp.]|jgi:chemotaxis protein CheD|uniref:chemoreceptor glutamine deamidase CheD n=1 Tax=Nitrosomonas sp. TaxID=42353 RepID=UPI0020831E51|nr:chemoreceptor glutamine deamidase CheD [Nitrosomonas sp.]GJL73935.1 MAG: putative chemoreceptor glutamine deamidase CheD 1 [Nitrosomonas sp.]